MFARRFYVAPLLASLGALGAVPLLPASFLGSSEPQAAAAEPCERNPEGCPELVDLEVRDVLPLPETGAHAVVLVTQNGEEMLPLFVDEGSAVAIAFRLAHRAPPHPLAHDLLDRVVTGLGGRVTEVRIDEVVDEVFHGRIFIKQGKRRLVLAARPSDSIAMALSAGDARIRVARAVLDSAGLTREDLESMRDQLGVGGSGPEAGPEAEGLELSPGHPPIPPRPSEGDVQL